MEDLFSTIANIFPWFDYSKIKLACNCQFASIASIVSQLCGSLEKSVNRYLRRNNYGNYQKTLVPRRTTGARWPQLCSDAPGLAYCLNNWPVTNVPLRKIVSKLRHCLPFERLVMQAEQFRLVRCETIWPVISSKYLRFSGEEQIEICTICQESIGLNDPVYLIRCHHQFHVQCIEGWLAGGQARSTQCPNCRAKII